MIGIDANVFIEVLEGRRKATLVLKALDIYQQRGEKAGLSTLTLSHLFYIAESHKVPLSRVEKLANAYKIYDVIALDAAWALEHYKGEDFEDALQVAAALREKCTTFLTLDRPMAKKYTKFLNIELIS